MSEPLELKKTVNLPKTNFGQKANLSQSEPARLKKWQEMDLYGKICESRKGKKRFILHDGPPYANADIHIGTALNKILKDFIVKSRTMMGFDSPYVPGYDCHGLPIEQFVEKDLTAKGKNKADLPAVTFRRICREHATKALKGQTRDFYRLGILGEWDNPYLTMSPDYEAETARLFGKFIERGYAYKGPRPVYWCINHQTALAEAEVEYRLHTSDSIYVKFPLKSDPAQIDEALAGKKVFVLIWTTTPWTLPANLGITVHPEFEYAAIENGDEVYIVASELISAVAAKCGIESEKVLARFKGAVLDRLECNHAWIDRVSLLMVGEHVTLGGEADAETELDLKEARDKLQTGKAGTGCVHTAPGHGHDDFVIGKQYGLDIYCPVDSGGRFVSEVEKFAGEKVFDANPKIVEFMRENGMLLYSERYEHRYPHCWRCKNPVIFRATPQWFISMDKVQASEEVERDEDGRVVPDFMNTEFDEQRSLREAAIREIERVRWIPEWGLDRMRNMFKGRPDWCVSRQRLWGVPIPVFYCNGCDEAIADAEIIVHVASLFEKETADLWYNREAKDLLPEGFTCPKCSGGDFRKETDILDVWFDSGVSSIAVLEHRKNLRWPADVYIEGGDQFRGWFNSSLMVGLAAHDSAPYKTVLTHGWVVDGEGKKLSKSAGTAVSPNEVVNESGAEILRLWAAAVDFTEDVRCSDEILKGMVEAYRKLRNTARYALGNLDGFNPSVDSVDASEMFEFDRWALNELNAVTEKCVDAYKEYDFQTVYHTLYNFATVTLSARYFDIIKDRLYTAAPKSLARRSAQTALYKVADSLARLLAVILAFTADEIWENIPRGETEEAKIPSVHIAEFPKVENERDIELEARWEKLFSVRDEVLKSLEEARNAKLIGSSLEAKVVLTATDETFDLLSRYADDLRYIFIVSQVELSKGDALKTEVKRADGNKCERCWNYSTQVGISERYPMVCDRCLEALAEIEET
jgi:isoleucyl-tRNA synthetase